MSDKNKWRMDRPKEPPTPPRGQPAIVICCGCGFTITVGQVANCPHCHPGTS